MCRHAALHWKWGDNSCFSRWSSIHSYLGCFLSQGFHEGLHFSFIEKDREDQHTVDVEFHLLEDRKVEPKWLPHTMQITEYGISFNDQNSILCSTKDTTLVVLM